MTSPLELAAIDAGTLAFWSHPHEPDDRCARWHCSSHHVDELAGPFPYQVCYECGHVYETAADLVRAYRRQYRDDWRHPWSRPRLLPNPFALTVWAWVRRYLFVRADTIFFCQACAHDF